MYSLLQRILQNPLLLIAKLLEKTACWYSDELYLRLQYLFRFHKRLDLRNPKSFNEKLQWLKLNNRKSEMAKMVDKVEAKEYVAKIIGEEHIIPTLGVYNSVDEIDFEKLPNQFVLKCTHDSGGIVICNDKSKLDIEAAKAKLRRGLKVNYYYQNREWPYKQVKPRIIAEQYMVDETGWQLKDYKIFCFNGEPKFIEVDYDRYVGHKLNVYDLNWEFIDFYMTSPNDKNVMIEKPKHLDKMLNLARQLAQDEIFVRVDFYSIGDKIYFGEFTYTPGSGFIDFHPKEWDEKLGKMLQLPI